MPTDNVMFVNFEVRSSLPPFSSFHRDLYGIKLEISRDILASIRSGAAERRVAAT
jgi:hypothetical protein